VRHSAAAVASAPSIQVVVLTSSISHTAALLSCVAFLQQHSAADISIDDVMSVLESYYSGCVLMQCTKRASQARQVPLPPEVSVGIRQFLGLTRARWLYASSIGDGTWVCGPTPLMHFRCVVLPIPPARLLRNQVG
jgi:hypothetical protein